MKFYKLNDGSGRYLGMEDTVPEHIIEQIPELIKSGLLETTDDKTYSEEEFQHHTNAPAPTWENTLACHGERSSAQQLMQTADGLGYTYFAWNGRIFKVTIRHNNVSYEMVQDIYEIDIK